MSRVAGVGPEPVEPLLVYAAQQLVEPVGHARLIVERVAQTIEGAGDGLCLLCMYPPVRERPAQPGRLND